LQTDVRPVLSEKQAGGKESLRGSVIFLSWVKCVLVFAGRLLYKYITKKREKTNQKTGCWNYRTTGTDKTVSGRFFTFCGKRSQ
jgi:hypothetical protein